MPATVAALRQFTELIRAENPDLPLVLLGHSWGSFLAQILVNDDPEAYDAVVLTGTALRWPGSLNAGALNAPWKGPDATGREWLSSDPAVGAAFGEDPLTTDRPLLALFGPIDAARLFGRPARGLRDRRTADLPVLIMVGREDTVGGAASAHRLARTYRDRSGLDDITTLIQAQRDAARGEVARRMAENEQIQAVSIRALAHLAEIRDPETGNHILRTQNYVRLLATLLAKHPRFTATLVESYLEMLARSAPLHDIGKVGIPDNVLLKPGKLAPEEWAIMKTHARLGSDAIDLAEQDIERPVEFLSLAKEIAHWHHERWDGSGYPDGLVGDTIPISARTRRMKREFGQNGE